MSSRKRVLGNGHPDTLSAMNNLASLYLTVLRYDEAEVIFKECLDIQQKVLGCDHSDTLNTVNGLASLYYRQRKFELAGKLFFDPV